MDAEDFEYYDVGVPLLQMHDALLNSKFQKIITVAKTTPNDGARANFRTSDSNSDTECIQAALNTAPDGSTLIIFEGTYSLTTQISQTGKNLNIIGMGKVIFNLTGTESDPGLSFSGSVLLTTTLQSNVALGARDIVLTSADSVQKGDIIQIYDPTIPVGMVAAGELYEITYTNSNTITLSQDILRNYSAASTVVKIYRPIQIAISNIEFTGAGFDSVAQGVRILYASNSAINNCNFHDSGLVNLLIYTSYNILIDHCNISNAHADTASGSWGYGVCIGDAAANITVFDNTISNCRHCVTCTCSSYFNVGLCRGISIIHNTISTAYGDVPTAYAIDTHPCTLNMLISNNTIYGHGRGVFWDGSLNSIFANNYIVNGGGVYTRNVYSDNITCALGHRCQTITNNQILSPHGAALYNNTASPDIIDSLIITGNSIKSEDSDVTYVSAKPGIYVDSGLIQNANINNNIIDGCKTNAIQIKPTTGSITPRINISDNIIKNVTADGIRLEYSTSADTIFTKISNNIITNTALDGASSAIYLNSVKLADVINNILDTSYYGIREVYSASPADLNNYIADNEITNCNTAIQKQGTTTTLHNNRGYPTENSGKAIINASATSVVVNHGLSLTPTNFTIVPQGNLGACWIDTITSTQMTLHCTTAPASNTYVFWSAKAV